MEFLKDGYRVEGSDLDEFKKAVDEFSSITKSVTTKNTDVTLLSVCKEEMDDRHLFYVLNRTYMDEFLNNSKLKKGAIEKSEFDEVLFEEMKNSSGLAVIVGKDKFLLSDKALATLTMRAGVSGEKTVARNNLVRDMHFADALTVDTGSTKFIYREVDNQKKIFACMGKDFVEIPMKILYDAIDLIVDENVLGKMEVKFWQIDHTFTDIYVEFPQAAEDFCSMYGLTEKIVPGLFLCTSDVGASSVIVRGTYRYKNRYIITDEVARRHSGDITVSDILELVNSKIFKNVRELPEKLVELIGESVLDYSVVDLSTEKGQAENFKATAAIIKNVVDTTLKGALSKKRRVALIDCMIDEINSTIPYTMYDIAMSFLGTPDRIQGLDNASMVSLQKACANVPFEINKKPNKKEEEILYLA